VVAKFLTKVLIWDADGAPPVSDGLVVLWRAFAGSADAGVVSIPALIEANAESLRARYLTWVYELGETSIRGKRLVDHLEIRPSFSYWWMTLFAEKCNYSKSPQIDDVIRLLAFEQWADQHHLSQVTLVTANAALAECMGSLCSKSRIAFVRQQPGPAAKDELSWTKRLYRMLPSLMQSFAWLLAYLLRRWPLRGIGLAEWHQSEGKITFFSYLFNLVPEAAKCGRFESRYWGHLPDEIRKDGIRANWLHLYVESDVLPSSAKAAGAIRQFNAAGQGEQTHVTLDSFLSLKVVFQTMRDGLRMWQLGQALRPSLVVSKATRINLWPLYRAEWAQSFAGPAAMSNALNLNLLEFAASCLPLQQAGVYLQESQAWEFALAHAWKAAGHRHLIAFPHSTVRYWDLRYFFSPQNYRDGERNGLPRPEQIAVNGVAVREALVTGGYPERDLVMVESLRYFHLLETRGADHRAGHQAGVPMRVLAMCDIVERNTERQMRLLEGAARFLPADTAYTVKPHPACAFAPDDYPGIRITVSMRPIAELLADCDVAYSSSVTSAAVDAYCAGVPVVSMLDPATLNLSPLRGCEDAVFASTPKELAEALAACASQPLASGKTQKFFTLDAGLPRWRKLLQAQDHASIYNAG
jgi:surface carbohydrate biosynthesis protein (TIGR04326 family)